MREDARDAVLLRGKLKAHTFTCYVFVPIIVTQIE